MTTSSYESLSHAKWDCKYHVVFILKGRKIALYGKIRRCLGPVLRELAGQRGSTILAGPTVQDHVHRLMRIPPKGARERAKPARVLSLLHECSLLR
jgi:putative transposase